MKYTDVCPRCKVNTKHVYKSGRRSGWCRSCGIEYAREYRRINRARINKRHIELCCAKTSRLPMSKSKNSPLFLGVYVAESILSHVFGAVQRMAPNFPGYDFICGKGYKIDCKSACLSNTKLRVPGWNFYIGRNGAPDYFICLAFDDRTSLSPQHVWIIPSEDVNTKKSFIISQNTLHKWKRYEHPLDDILSICNIMRGDIIGRSLT